MTDMPAFPVITNSGINHSGMTLRDYFAGQALRGAAALGSDPQRIADAAYAIADAMLKARDA